ncbi:MAG: hypothetical protein ABJZ62_08760 [Hyphomicrobiales bacterium]
MNIPIFYVGGASASGKSFTGSKIAQDADLTIVGLDDYYNQIAKKDLIDNTKDDLTKELSIILLGHLIESKAQCIVEGAYLHPYDTLKFSAGQLYPVFCGYPNADPIKRLDEIILGKDGKKKHWLFWKDRDYAISWLKTHIDGSKWYQNECKKYSIPFVDFSDFQHGENELMEHYRKFAKKD